MNITLNSKTKITITAIVLVFVSGLLLLEHLQGGVGSHYLFASKDMPKMSNWWGLLIVPSMTWILLSLMQKNHKGPDGEQRPVYKQEINGFIGAFLFGITMTILYYNSPDLPGYFMLMTFALALFLPIYRPQYFLGFMLSMTYGFGGVLPVIFGLILVPIYFIEYRFIRTAFLFIWNKIK